MKVNIPLRFHYLPVYILIASLFYSSLAFNYAALALFLIFYVGLHPKIRINFFFGIPFLILLAALISYGYNLFFTELADGYSILFWLLSYFPPFLLMWIVLFYRGTLDFFAIYRFYKFLVYVQTFLLIFSAYQFRTLVVGDPATGTLGDANWVAFHICVVLIYEVCRVIYLSKNNIVSFKDNARSLIEISYFFVTLIIPESTANLGFIFIIFAIIFFREYLMTRLRFGGIITFFLCSAAGLYFVSDTVVFQRIKFAIEDLAEDNIDRNPYLFKASIYRKIATFQIYRDVNFLVGSGPSTFTSRSSVMRMPIERVNEFFIDVPYFKNEVFATYISPVYARWRISGESHGNFASPQTTVVSLAVELGLLGLLIFALYFRAIFRTLGRIDLDVREGYLTKFGKYFTLFFVLNLFHLNFWEYPIICFTFILFIFLIIRLRHAPKEIQAEHEFRPADEVRQA